jgi:hypothetical protein
MIRFSAGLVGLIAIASANDNISLLLLIPAGLACIAVMLSAVARLAE